MKRFISVLLVIVTLASLATTVFAAEETNTSSGETMMEARLPIYTTEDEMPAIPITYTLDAKIPKNTLDMPERQAWASDTAKILEQAYHQSVSSIYESDATVTFEFEAPTAEEFQFGVAYVMKEEYQKPEASRSSDYPTKMSYTYGFAEGIYPDNLFDVDSHKGTWSQIMDTIVTVVGLHEKMSLAAAIYSLFGIAREGIQPMTTIDFKNLAQYYVLNKVGVVKNPTTGVWIPMAYVGMRKDFRNAHLYELVNHYSKYLGSNITEPDNYTNPTNADATDYKPHYGENQWILDKAVKCLKTDQKQYIDVYFFLTGPYDFTDKYPVGK